MHWRTKGIVQKVLCNIPKGERIHTRLQRRIGGLSNFEAECKSKIDDWIILANHLKAIELPFCGSTFFEVGTGWYPTLPFCTMLAGAQRVITYDLTNHLLPDLTMNCAETIGRNTEAIAEVSGRSKE